jgi:hypothetical protein
MIGASPGDVPVRLSKDKAMFGSKKQDAVTQDAVMKALSTVQEPELHKIWSRST